MTLLDEVAKFCDNIMGKLLDSNFWKTPSCVEYVFLYYSSLLLLAVLDTSINIGLQKKKTGVFSSFWCGSPDILSQATV